MILQALHGYYERKMRDPNPALRLPTAGLEDKEIPFILELTADGRLVSISDTRTQEGKRRHIRRFLVPQSVKRASGVAANLLWDTAAYVLGLDMNGKPQRVDEQKAAFRQRIEVLFRLLPNDAGLAAVEHFLNQDPIQAIKVHAAWAEIAKDNPVLTFRLSGEIDLVCQRPEVAKAIAVSSSARANNSDIAMPCLITAGRGAPERLHTAIKGVWGAQTSGANIISFNVEAFRSFGKEKGANAPVSPEAAFAYTTALNSLLAKGSRQRMQVGDASTVFWAQESVDADFENAFAALFSDDADRPDAHTEQVRALLEAIHTGRFDREAGERKFFVLGLAPNAARISIRFWQAATLREISYRVQQWFTDLEIDRAPHDPEFLPLKRLLSSACLATRDRPHGDIEKLPPSTGGDVMRAILQGTELPSLLLNAVIGRCRAEQAKKDDKTGRPVRHVSHARAALLRASINRHRRIHEPQSQEITVSLDKDFRDPSYALGRLFAVYEKVQESAAGRELNKTIRDAFFGAAMATPRAVFPRLVRLNQFHRRDLKRGNARLDSFFDKLILEINDKIDPKNMYPAMHSLKEQGVFALGYYHQRQGFFSKADSVTTPVISPAPSATAIPAQASLI